MDGPSPEHLHSIMTQEMSNEVMTRNRMFTIGFLEGQTANLNGHSK